MTFTSFFGALALTALISVTYYCNGFCSPLMVLLTFAVFGGPFMFMTKPNKS
jgi:hypothetical protein